jgi:fluoride exporter
MPAGSGGRAGDRGRVVSTAGSGDRSAFSAPSIPVWLAVALGSALGGLARAALAVLLAAEPGAWPWATWWANAAGSFAIVLFASLTAPQGRVWLGPATRQGFMAGFCGGFTTFSIFSLETLALLTAGAAVMALGYAVATVAGALLAAWLGFVLASRINR